MIVIVINNITITCEIDSFHSRTGCDICIFRLICLRCFFLFCTVFGKYLRCCQRSIYYHTGTSHLEKSNTSFLSSIKNQRSCIFKHG